jgi:hypothetical protein
VETLGLGEGLGRGQRARGGTWLEKRACLSCEGVVGGTGRGQDQVLGFRMEP